MLITEQLIALIEHSEARNVKASVLAAGGDVLEIAGGVAAFAGDGNPMTQVAGVGSSHEVSHQEFEQIIDFYKYRATQFEFKLSPLSNQALRTMVVRAAKSLPEFESLLVYDLQGTEITVPEMDIRQVMPSEAKAFAKRAVDRFHSGGTPPPGLVETIERAAFREGMLSFEVWMDGTPVAGCGLCLDGDVAWHVGAATSPEYRGRGLHKAMQKFRMHMARQYGCQIVIQAALPGSQSQLNAQKSGFHIAFTRPTFYL